MIFRDRVQEYGTTEGIGRDVVLAGAVSASFDSFAGAFSIGQDDIPYAVVDMATGAWEIRAGALTDAVTLSRTRLYSSSNAGADVAFTAGRKHVFTTVPAAVLQGLEPSSLPTRVQAGGRWFGITYVEGQYTVIAEDDASTLVVRHDAWQVTNATGDIA